MFHINEVRVLEGYRLWLRFDDGTTGEVDVSDLAGRGVFEAWQDRVTFEAVRVTEAGAIAWPGGLDLCPDSLYLRLTGKTPDEVFPALKSARGDA